MPYIFQLNLGYGNFFVSLLEAIHHNSSALTLNLEQSAARLHRCHVFTDITFSAAVKKFLILYLLWLGLEVLRELLVHQSIVLPPLSTTELTCVVFIHSPACVWNELPSVILHPPKDGYTNTTLVFVVTFSSFWLSISGLTCQVAAVCY